MVKKLLSIVLALTFSAVGMAQGRIGTYSIIPRIGVTYSNLTDDKMTFISATSEETGNSKNLIGYTFGADVEYMITESAGISMGVFYSQQGDKYSIYSSDKTSAESLKVENDLNYINVPIFFNKYLGNTGIAIKAGIQQGFLIYNRVKYTENDASYDKDGNMTHSSTESHSSKGSWKHYSLSIPVAISYEYQNVILEAKYAFGLLNVRDNGLSDNNRNMVFSITAGYRLEL